MSLIPLWIQAIFWGSFTGAALIIGALIGYFLKMSQRVVGGIMAFGSGALISALSFELIGEAYNKGGLLATGLGFIIGGIIYSVANLLVSNSGAKHRKRANINNNLDLNNGNSNGVAIALGALIDGIPESLVIGLGIIGAGPASLVTIGAIFISNIPEGLSSSAGMKNNGKTFKYIFRIWIIITIMSGISSLVGYLFFKDASVGTISFIMAIAAGAILAMVADTMMPEAFEETHNFAGFITVIGFLCAFMLQKI